MKKNPALLTNPATPRLFRIDLRLQEGKTASFEFNDREIARTYYDQLQGIGVVAGLAIKQIEFTEITE